MIEQDIFWHRRRKWEIENKKELKDYWLVGMLKRVWKMSYFSWASWAFNLALIRKWWFWREQIIDVLLGYTEKIKNGVHSCIWNPWPLKKTLQNNSYCTLHTSNALELELLLVSTSPQSRLDNSKSSLSLSLSMGSGSATLDKCIIITNLGKHL